MVTNPKALSYFVAIIFLVGLGGSAWTSDAIAANPCNPCAAKNPCGAKNPCASKNPCAAKNPCGAKNPCATKNPCGAKNPCATKNPCGAKNPCGGASAEKLDPKLVTRPKGTKLKTGTHSALLSEGKRLWNDTSLSTNNLSCNSCHVGNTSFMPTFTKPYPHFVQMGSDRFGLKQIHADEMVQMCMVVPMAAKPLPWSSQQLAALTAYTEKVQKDYVVASKAGKVRTPAANPCNPCAAKNPCGAKNPCSMKK